MEIPMKCPKCQKSWNYKPRQTPIPVYCTCPGCFSKVRVRTLPDPSPLKTPPSLKKLRKAVMRQAESDSMCQTVRGEVTKTPAGNEVETIVTPSPVKHSVRPLATREVIGNCKYCGNPLREKPQLNIMLDERDRYHSTCILTKIIMESDGDLQAAAEQYGVPLEPLQKRVLKLKELGKQLPEGVLV